MTASPHPLVTVVGGSGFLGRHVVKALARAGWRVRVLCRDAIAAEFLKTAGTVGQIVTQYADVTKPATLVGNSTARPRSSTCPACSIRAGGRISAPSMKKARGVSPGWRRRRT